MIGDAGEDIAEAALGVEAVELGGLDADQQSMLRKLVLPDWRLRKVAEITPTDVDRLLKALSTSLPAFLPSQLEPERLPRENAQIQS